MWNATIKSLLAHKLRLVLTALAIVLGVGFVSGTYVLTDTVNASFSEVFDTVTQGVDVAVRNKETFAAQDGIGSSREPVPADLVDEIRGVDGVKAAEGSVTGFAQLVGKDGKPVETGGAPTFGVSIGSTPELTSGSTVRAGRLPRAPGEIVVDARTAERQRFNVGDRVKVLLQGPAQTFELVGVIGFGEADNLAGATLVGFQLETAQRVLNREGRYDQIDVVAEEGVRPEDLRDRIRAEIDPRYEALTGTELADESTKELTGSLGRILNVALLSFAGVALLVGAFIIFNTFSIIVAQRTRELALLRCLGASRGQVLRSVLTESLIVGLVASVAGLFFGLVIAVALRALLEAFGGDLPSTGIQFLPRTVIVSLLVGIVVTLVSAVMPAVKATRVPPVAALREEAAAAPPTRGRRRSVVGFLVTGAGMALLLLGLFGDQGLVPLGAGAVLVFLGVAVLSPLLARPLAAVIGAPFERAFRPTGRLARQNAMRNPRRTASTAAALMIGLALVGFVAILGESLRASIDSTLDRVVAAEYTFTGSGFFPFSPEVVKRLSELPDLEAVAGVRSGAWKLDGVNKVVAGVDPQAYGRVVRTEVTAGSLEGMAGGVAVKDEVAQAQGWKLGDTVTMQFPRGGTERLPIKAIYKDNELNGDYLMALSDFERHYTDQQDFLALATVREGADLVTTRAAIDRVLADFPNVRVQDKAGYKREVSNEVNQLLGLVVGLLLLAILIALFGIVNTLALSVFERVRELGLLRAVGATRRQLRAMIRWEAVIVALLGAVLGLVVGAVFGWLTVQALDEEGITEFALPAGQLVAYFVVAALVGVLAAIFPGMRAARVDMLRAIATE